MTEHVIIAFKLFLTLAIRDKPEWVLKEEQERGIYEESIRDTIEAIKDEYIDKGGVIMEERIQQIKR